MFENISLAPADPILGLNEAFKADTRVEKVNLGVGAYKDNTGITPILNCVKKAEELLLQSEISKSYLGIDGLHLYNQQVQELLFGSNSPIIKNTRAKTAQAPGGTAALKIAADFIKKNLQSQKVWISNPSWANHRNIFTSAGLEVDAYRYYNAKTKSLDFDGLMEDLSTVAANDVVILHACCHNPSGVDPTHAQWQALADLAAEKKFLVLFDIAYQGFSEGLEEDAFAIRLFAQKIGEFLVASSFSKNFGLYNERIGAFTLVAEDTASANNAFSQVKQLIRSNYSNPPAHGGLVVSTILSDETLKTLWIKELADMRERIHLMRTKLQDALSNKIPAQDFSFIGTQKGMFSFSGLNKNQVEKLQQEKGIYIVGSGRINVAGITDDHLEYLVDAIASMY